MSDIASSDFFLNPKTGSPDSCPANSICIGRDYMPIPITGYWVNWDKSNDAGFM